MISVIVPAKDAAETLEDCLSSLQSQQDVGQDYEIILVDDGSNDRTAEIAQCFGVPVIRPEYQGRSVARNVGAKAARGDILAFTDADCAPAADWLHHLVEPFKVRQGVGTKGVYRSRQTGLVPRFV
ncbi:MAG: glycosyltransferase family 2 protein, partial [Anaerolineales bacterium]|nr:glycosyltransferase family 2 protein [Anaerolineales bacterium]